MAYEIFDASPQAKAKIASYEDASGVSSNEHHHIKYPFDELKIGQCFTIPIADANETSLRLTASNRGKKTGKKFCVLKHKDFGCIEVARIA